MPYTSTGYVRRLAKNAISSVNYQWRKNIQPDKNVYELLRQAFRGGNTHANRFFIGQLLKVLIGVQAIRLKWSIDYTQFQNLRKHLVILIII